MLGVLTGGQLQCKTSTSSLQSWSGIASLRILLFPFTHGGPQAANEERNLFLEQALVLCKEFGSTVVVEK